MAQDYSKEITRLEAIVNGATTSVSTDGLSTTFDLDAARTQLAELKRKQGSKSAKSLTKPIDMRGCF